MSTQIERARRAAEDSKYLRQVAEALDARAEKAQTWERTIDAARDRVVIFSDLHKGARNGADDFRRTERAYNAALAWYFRLGYTLVVVGDVEELWEERPGPVLKTYRHTLELEACFHREGRYLRFWGNHDDLWRFPAKVESLLGEIFRAGPDGRKLEVHEALYVPVADDGEPLGRLLLLHGHQGTTDSDRWGPWARYVVRWIWRPVQRLFNVSVNTPAEDFVLRHKHSVAMYRWAERRNEGGKAPLVLVAGHTHQPVFASQTHEAQVRDRLEKTSRELDAAPESEELRRAVGELEAELEWIRAEGRGKKGGAPPTDMPLPCYFNTGCCCFTDGDITGLEIADGEIRLVRWPDDGGAPRPETLIRRPIREVFHPLGGPAPRLFVGAVAPAP